MRLALVLAAITTIETFAQAPQATDRPAKLIGFSDTSREKFGKISRIEVTGSLDVQIPGIYTITFLLTTAHGRSLTGRGDAALEKGSQSLSASFEPKQIRDYLAEDGPYRISDVRLFLEEKNGEGRSVDSMKDGGTTAVHRLSDLYLDPRDSYRFTGDVEAEGVDRGPDGKFRKLAIRFGVDTPVGNAFGGEL